MIHNSLQRLQQKRRSLLQKLKKNTKPKKKKNTPKKEDGNEGKTKKEINGSNSIKEEEFKKYTHPKLS